MEAESTHNEDKFVKEERERLENEIDGISGSKNNRGEMDILKVHNLVKQYSRADPSDDTGTKVDEFDDRRVELEIQDQDQPKKK